jgi:S-adenosylmethionine:tRNA ribosyltransferase-isomerase
MRTDEFNYFLPEELIAQYPPIERGGSRLLYLHAANGQLEDRRFMDFLDLLLPQDLLVFNDTRVLPARLFGRKTTGGKVEILLERVLDEHTMLAQIRASKTLQPGRKDGVVRARTAGTCAFAALYPACRQ